MELVPALDTARFDEYDNIWIMGRSDDVVNISGHRLGTMEIESAIVSHEFVAESAVVSYKHEIKGEAIHAFVTLGEKYSKDIGPDVAEEIREWVKDKIGSIAKPDKISFSTSLPKTRSGKIINALSTVSLDIIVLPFLLKLSTVIISSASQSFILFFKDSEENPAKTTE